MRPDCPICGLAPIDSFSTRYAIPDGWTLPADYHWRLCKCGFIWADTNAQAEDFDQFYRDNYNPHIDAHDLHRMQQLAGFIFGRVKPNARVVDYGGGEGYLANYLRELGFENVSVVNLDDKMPKCDVVILSQVIEHLYDLERDLDKIDANLENDEPVIIYGLGDFALYQIANSDLNIAYFVDEAEVYRGATLNGIPIKQALGDDDYPVMVISNRHRAEILGKLKGRRVIET